MRLSTYEMRVTWGGVAKVRFKFGREWARQAALLRPAGDSDLKGLSAGTAPTPL